MGHGIRVEIGGPPCLRPGLLLAGEYCMVAGLWASPSRVADPRASPSRTGGLRASSSSTGGLQASPSRVAGLLASPGLGLTSLYRSPESTDVYHCV